MCDFFPNWTDTRFQKEEKASGDNCADFIVK